LLWSAAIIAEAVGSATTYSNAQSFIPWVSIPAYLVLRTFKHTKFTSSFFSFCVSLSIFILCCTRKGLVRICTCYAKRCKNLASKQSGGKMHHPQFTCRSISSGLISSGLINPGLINLLLASGFKTPWFASRLIASLIASRLIAS
jgi:hypothetical protein